MAVSEKERQYIRDMAKKYMEYALSPELERRRAAWSAHHALHFTRPLIYIRAIPFDEFIKDSQLQCTDKTCRALELHFLQTEYRSRVADDYITEPFYTVPACIKTPEMGAWGLPAELGERSAPHGAAAYHASIIEEEDIEKVVSLPHEVDEEATRRRVAPFEELVGDILPIFVDREGVLSVMWQNDISTPLAKLRGLEQLMWDMYDRPEWLHDLVGRMQKMILKNMDETLAAGDYSLANQRNQAMPYADELQRPNPAVKGVRQDQMWGYMAAQEFTMVGPDLFEEFMFNYQKPILERYALSAYGCCEDMSNKIQIVKKLSNLRRIAVSPFSDLKKCAEQIGGDYILSWRPNPSSMVSFGVDEDMVRKFLRDGFDILDANHCKFDITLKDVETVSGDAQAIIRWTAIVRDEIDRRYGK